MEKHLLTIDVEDNFTFEELSNKNDWQKYEGQVVENTLKLLWLLKKFNAKATFFIVGTVAERHPEIVLYLIKEGHEIASHSYYHKPLSTLSWNEIELDIKKSKEILYSISSSLPIGYRAMGYSIPNNKEKFFGLLGAHGFKYDSSCKYSLQNSRKTIIKRSIYSVYPSYLKFLGRKIIFSGGTYFRLMPMKAIERGFNIYIKNNEPVMLYIHPWELNKDQPKRNVSFKQRIFQSPLTFTTELKLRILLEKYRFTSIKEYLGL